MKRLFLLFILSLVMANQKAGAQAVLSMSPVYSNMNDTLPAYSNDTVVVWVKNTGTSTYNNSIYLARHVQDSASSSYHGVDTLYSFIPTIIAPGDSVSFGMNTDYTIDSTKYHYDINVIVIWPLIVTGGGATIGDSLSYIQVITLPAGMDEIDLGELISTYPNPAAGNIRLKNEGKISIEEVRIYDTGGRWIQTIRDPEIICTDEWKAGMYLLHITTKDKRTCTIRVLKQK